MVRKKNSCNEGNLLTPEPTEIVLTDNDLKQTAESIAEWQLESGMIPWFPGGHADPWNHVEATMALQTAGLVDEALKGYEWLERIQRDDGSWHNYYLEDRIEQDKIDSNCVAYIATGVLHSYLISQDMGFLESMWKVVEPAIDFVVDMQTERGEIIWARHSDGTLWSYALLTGSSSIAHSIRSAIKIATELGFEKKRWESSYIKLANVIQTVPDAFAPKNRWAMDWYYPVLSGVVTGEMGIKHLAEKNETFEIPGKGIRCVSDRPWITTAETCECAIAFQSIGETQHALELFKQIQKFRNDKGQYLTGVVYPESVSFPEEEYSTYSAAAVVLAADSLMGITKASQLFSNHEFLPVL